MDPIHRRQQKLDLRLVNDNTEMMLAPYGDRHGLHSSQSLVAIHIFEFANMLVATLDG